MVEFTGKRIVITGGAGGIGIETARQLMDRGGHVVLVDRDAGRLDQARDILGRVRLATFVSALDTPAACATSLRLATDMGRSRPSESVY